jgi:hypothetical protein
VLRNFVFRNKEVRVRLAPTLSSKIPLNSL